MSQRNIFSEFILYLLPQNPQSERAREIARLYTPSIQIYDVDIYRRPAWLDGVPMLRNEQTGDIWKGQPALEQLKYMGMSSKITWSPLPAPPPKVVDLNIGQIQQPPAPVVENFTPQQLPPQPQPSLPLQAPVYNQYAPQPHIQQYAPQQYAPHPVQPPIIQPYAPQAVYSPVQPQPPLHHPVQPPQPSYPTIQQPQSQQQQQPIAQPVMEQKIKANQVQDLPPPDVELGDRIKLPDHISGFRNPSEEQPQPQQPSPQIQQPQQPQQQQQQRHQSPTNNHRSLPPSQPPSQPSQSPQPPQLRRSKRVQPAAKSVHGSGESSGEHIALTPEEQNKFETIREPDDHIVALRSSTIHIPDIIEEEEPSHDQSNQ